MQIRTNCPYDNNYYIRQVNGGWNGAIQGKPTKAGANVLANCVGYANGRFAEIQDTNGIKYQLVCNAENFIEKAKAYGLQVVDYPTLGGIMVWQKGSLASGDGAGHVAIVERLDGKNQIYTSESAYNGSAFFNANRNNSNGRWGMGSAYKFRACIINPAIGDVHWIDPEPTGDTTIREIQNWLNATYGTGLTVDGLYGPQTKRALTKGLQTELNKQYGAGLVVDGIFGPATKRACVIVRKGARGNITKLIQSMLYCRGYNPNGIDGIFGNGTEKAVKNFQSRNGLYVDGIVGKNTFEKLFK